MSEVCIDPTYKFASYSDQQSEASPQAPPVNPPVTEDDTASIQVTNLRVEGLGNSNNLVLKDSYLNDVRFGKSLNQLWYFFNSQKKITA